MKRYYKSRTFWVGVLEFIAGVTLAIAGHIEVGGALTVAGILTVVLRHMTKEQISYK